MKIKSILALAVVGSILSLTSCKKDSTGGTVNLLVEDSLHDGDPNDVQIRVFEYNTSHQLVKVKYRYGTSTTYSSYDTIKYSGGHPIYVLSYNGGASATDSSHYYYTGDVLDSSNSGGSSYDMTNIFHYSSSTHKLDSVNIVNYVGSGSGPSSIGHIVFAGDNFSTAIAYTPTPVAVTISVDTHPNPYYGLIFKESNDPLILFNKNNVTGITNVPYNARTYTYNSDGTVATITDGGDITSMIYAQQ
jgi:YD repeat-containing protein